MAYLELPQQPRGMARAARPVAAPAQPERAGMSGPPLTGCDAELAALTRELKHALAGTTRIVGVFGEAGVGKIRLVKVSIFRSMGPSLFKSMGPRTESAPLT